MAETQVAEIPAQAALTSCRKFNRESESFVENVKGYVQEFINAPMVEHKACFRQTFDKIIDKFDLFTEKPSSAAAVASKEGESQESPLQTEPSS